MKNVLSLAVPMCVLLSGCVAARHHTGPPPGGPSARPVMSLSPLVPGYAGVSPIGRWDVVMTLEPGHAVQVLMPDATVVKGTVVGVTFSSLRVRAGAGDLDLPATDVMRVDSVIAPGPGPLRNGAVGAAWGVGLVALVGLVVGRVPPAGAFVGTAALAANQSIQYGRRPRDPVTIYVSPAMVPRARPAVK